MQVSFYKNYNLKDKDLPHKEVLINDNGVIQEKYVDITLENIYDSTVRYGMYYYPITPEELPENVIVKLAEDSKDLVENNIKPKQTRSDRL